MNKVPPAVNCGGDGLVDYQTDLTCTITGFKGQTCLLSYIEIDAGSGAEGAEQNAVRLTPEADTDRARATVQTPITRAGTFVVRFILYDPRGTELARRDSEQANVR